MGATSNTVHTRDTIYNDLLEKFFIEGEKHILAKNFALGEDWDVAKIDFLYLYITLLSNFSCDVEAYFNDKLKEILNINTSTKISLSTICSEDYIQEISISETDSASLVKWFISCVNQTA